MSKAVRFHGAIKTIVTALLLAFGISQGTAYAERPHLHHAISSTHSNVLVMVWYGKIEAPMSAEISDAFDHYKDRVNTVELKLDLGGGSVKEGERVISILQNIKKTHKLVTAVGAGKKCGSMCVFIYVQGQKRLAAPASLWLFHEVSIKNEHTHRIARLDRVKWEQLVDRYWIPAGINPTWIANVKAHTVKTDYWQSGESLLNDGANIILQPMSDEHRRVVEPAQGARAN